MSKEPLVYILLADIRDLLANAPEVVIDTVRPDCGKEGEL